MTSSTTDRAPPEQSDAPIRVLVVDDSAVDRRMLIALLESDPRVQVAGWAASGADAIQAATRLAPDVITMDFFMPLMDGLEATRRILQAVPTPIVLVTSAATENDCQLTRTAIEAGVLAVVPKPRLSSGDSQPAEEFLRVVKSMAEIVIVGRRSTAPTSSSVRRTAGGMAPSPTRPIDVVAIGASTGGPQAILEILSGLPGNFEPPILIVQHMAAGFTSTLVDWLKSLCSLPVQIATSGVELGRPGAYVAPTDQHLVVRDHHLVLTNDPPIHNHRPAANALFRSVAAECGAGAIGVLLSGMGDDGALGMGDLKRAGSITIAQDEASSIVFGMPAVAIGLGVVDFVKSPADIAVLVGQLGRRGRSENQWNR